MMDETVKIIDERIKKVDTEFGIIQKQTMQAEQMVIKGQEQLVRLQGARAELDNMRVVLVKQLSGDPEKEKVVEE